MFLYLLRLVEDVAQRADVGAKGQHHREGPRPSEEGLGARRLA